jgi:hypothetical protein
MKADYFDAVDHIALLEPIHRWAFSSMCGITDHKPNCPSYLGAFSEWSTIHPELQHARHTVGTTSDAA